MTQPSRAAQNPTGQIRAKLLPSPDKYDTNDTTATARNYWESNDFAVPRAGIEPATRGFSVHCSTD